MHRQCVFTTHTPVTEGHDRFAWPLVRQVLGEPVPAALLRQLAGDDDLNMTLLALNLSGWVNGVARRHAETSSELFPGHVVHAIANGVHAWTWASDAHRALYDRFVYSQRFSQSDPWAERAQRGVDRNEFAPMAELELA